MSNNSFPDVYIETDALNKLKAYYKYADKEISGLGVTAIEDGFLIVRDVLLFEQESSASETELNADTLAKWDYQIRRADGDPTQYRLWWHKHPITGWSSVDENNIEGMNNGDWLLSIVKQSNGQLLARLDLYSPFRITMDGLEILELRDQDDALDLACKAEVALKVKAKVWVNTYQGSFKGGTWIKNPDGSFTRVENEKKQLALPSNASNNGHELYVPNTNNTALNADDTDNYWASLADSDWEYNYSWEEVAARRTAYERLSE